MGERYRSIYFAIVGLTGIWFVIILLCLPQANNDIDKHHWQTTTSSKLVLDHPIRSRKQQEFDVNDNGSANRRRHHDQHAENILTHYQGKQSLTRADTLFYGLNLNSNHDHRTNESSISKELHDRVTLKLGSIYSSIDQHVKYEGHKLFAFNLLVSNRIGPFRLLPDTRHKECRDQRHTNSFNESPEAITLLKTSNLDPSESAIKLKASIIICYYNEAPSALLRTICTVLKRSPLNLIQEIIVVDDFSNQEYHFSKISPFVSSKLVTFTRTANREGLIRARLFGANLAKGEVLIFLDSHVEANVGWLEPLMKTIQQDKSTIACPMIDIINAKTLIYSASPIVKGGLDWALNFKWDSVPSHKLKTYDDFIKPIDSPTLAGGLYAIGRDFFYKLGGYDPGMELWGGENVELSLRTWMCGGRIVILPCSRLGHIFRKRRPYGPEPDQPDSLLINSHRTARVWLDDYIHKFYEANPDAKYLVSGDVSQRLELKHRLGCHDFSWFLENIYPDLGKEMKRASLHDTSYDNMHPKPVNLFQKRVDRNSRWRNNQINLTGGASSNSRLQRHLLNSNQNIPLSKGRLSFDFGPLDLKHNYLPKVVSQFQIQSADSNFCIESKRGFIPKGFARLILNHCAEVKRDKNGEILINNSTILDQLWTETELHDYRLGDNQCLDLIKNLPLLRKCHNMGSFQDWTHNIKMTNDTNIYNSDGVLCLGVERVQVGEPIIVTICDRQITSGEDSNAKLSKRAGRIRQADMASPVLSAWSPNREFREIIMERLRPSQRWSLTFINQSNRLKT